MVKNRFFLTGLFLLVLLVLYYSFFDGTNGTPTGGLNESIDPEVYRQQMDSARKQKDNFFLTDAGSPILDKTAFKALTYFEPDPAYRVVARLEPFADKTQKLVVRMSDGSQEIYDKFAHAVFSLNGTACRLLVVKLQNTYSILFRDVTSGKETYGGGRYIELDPAKLTDTHVVLDFNTAYNPYCAYNPTYACPIPPAENTLSVAVRAGEQHQ